MRGIIVAAILLTATPALAIQVAQTSTTDLIANGAGTSSPELKTAPKTPCRLTGAIDVDGVSYAYGSGGYGCSIPAGDHQITPDEVGSWGARHGAMGIAHGEMWDSRLGREREGIEIHADLNGSMKTEGCVAIVKFNEFKRKVLAMIAEFGRAFLHIDVTGARVSPFPEPVRVVEAKVDIGSVRVARHRHRYASHHYRHYAHRGRHVHYAGN